MKSFSTRIEEHRSQLPANSKKVLKKADEMLALMLPRGIRRVVIYRADWLEIDRALKALTNGEITASNATLQGLPLVPLD